MCPLIVRPKFKAFRAVVAKHFHMVGFSYPKSGRTYLKKLISNATEPLLVLKYKKITIGNFINDAIFKDKILINGNGSPYRSYLYISDTLIWLTKLLVGNEEGVFNVGSERRIQIIELANMVRDIIAPSKEVIIQEKEVHEGNFKRDVYLPNTTKIRESLGVKEWTSLENAISKTAKFTS